jgi:hypothetical protein
MFSYFEFFFIDNINRTPIKSIKITEDRSLFTQTDEVVDFFLERFDQNDLKYDL